MAWIESHQTLAGHPKTRKLARLLKVSKPAAIGHLHCLWWWAIDYAEDGDLSRYDEMDIAIASEWEGDPADLFDALVMSGFLDLTTTDGTAACIHDWDDYAGKLIERRKANAERMRKARAEQDAGTNNERASHVQRTQRARVERPNQTVPNHTVPNHTEPQEPPRKRDEGSVRLTYSTAFESFWQAYPSGHGVKKAAYEHWKRIKPDDAMVEEILAGVHGWLQSDRWRRGYVMDAQRWLKDRAWESVPPPQTALTVHQGGNTSRAAPGKRGYTGDELLAMSRASPDDDPANSIFGDVIDVKGRMVR